jgi:hypothetical protein
MNNPTTLAGSPQTGGTTSWKIGVKKRHLDPVILANISSIGADNGAANYALKLRGLSADLAVLVAVGVSGGLADPIYPVNYPAVPGTMQVLPKTSFAGYPLFLREVFQDPTATNNNNNALAQKLPYGWSFFPNGVDEAQINISIPAGAYATSGLTGVLVCQVVIEYVGAALNVSNENDRRMIEQAIGQVQVSGGPSVANEFGGG